MTHLLPRCAQTRHKGRIAPMLAHEEVGDVDAKVVVHTVLRRELSRGWSELNVTRILLLCLQLLLRLLDVESNFQVEFGLLLG